MRRNTFRNLSDRLAAEWHGAGLATELPAEAARRANLVRTDAPVLARLLEHNVASAGVARTAALTLQYLGPNVGIADSAAIPFYSDRILSESQLDAALPHPV